MLGLEFLLLGVKEGQEFAITDEVPGPRDKERQYYFFLNLQNVRGLSAQDAADTER